MSKEERKKERVEVLREEAAYARQWFSWIQEPKDDEDRRACLLLELRGFMCCVGLMRRVADGMRKEQAHV